MLSPRYRPALEAIHSDLLQKKCGSHRIQWRREHLVWGKDALDGKDKHSGNARKKAIAGWQPEQREQEAGRYTTETTEYLIAVVTPFAT